MSFEIHAKNMFQRPHATMAYKVGYEEDSFLKSLAPLEPTDIELKADNCTKVCIKQDPNIFRLKEKLINFLLLKSHSSNFIHFFKICHQFFFFRFWSGILKPERIAQPRKLIT